jgi:hypothetical protein
MNTNWERYSISKRAKIDDNEITPMDCIYHVAHVSDAQRIIEDGNIRSNLVRDQSRLNTSRICVVWTSPNHWYQGSMYGNISFRVPVSDILKDRHFYKVEVMTMYKPHAIRILVSDKEMDHPLLEEFDPQERGNPIFFDGAAWYRRDKFNYEVMFPEDLSLNVCDYVGFVSHHPRFCNKFGTGLCPDAGRHSVRAAERFVGTILALGKTSIAEKMMSQQGRVEGDVMGALTEIYFMLQEQNKDAKCPSQCTMGMLRAGLLALGQGQEDLAKICLTAIGDQIHAENAFGQLVKSVFGKDWVELRKAR